MKRQRSEKHATNVKPEDRPVTSAVDLWNDHVAPGEAVWLQDETDQRRLVWTSGKAFVEHRTAVVALVDAPPVGPVKNSGAVNHPVSRCTPLSSRATAPPADPEEVLPDPEQRRLVLDLVDSLIRTRGGAFLYLRLEADGTLDGGVYGDRCCGQLHGTEEGDAGEDDTRPANGGRRSYFEPGLHNDRRSILEGDQ